MTTAVRDGKQSVSVPVAKRPDGSDITIPLLIVRGNADGPTCCVDAMTHGDEHEGLLAVLHLYHELDPETLRGTFIGVPALHVAALEALQRANPFDHWNGDLNRVFPGSATGNLAQRIAHAYVNEVAADADFAISVHSGASYLYWSPLVMWGGDGPSLELAQALGRPWDVIGSSEGVVGSAYHALTARGTAAVAIEVGGAGERVLEAFDRNVDLVVGAVHSAMRHYGMLDGPVERPASWTYVRNSAIRSRAGGVAVPVQPFPLRERVAEGTPLMRLYGLDGEELETVTSPFDGVLLGFRSYSYAPAGWPLLWIGRPVEAEALA
jgi:predicted deacylase